METKAAVAALTALAQETRLSAFRLLLINLPLDALDRLAAQQRLQQIGQER